MRKRAKYMLATLLMFCFTANVKAAECSYEKQVELNNIASTVKATYESVEIDTGETYFDDMNFDENGNYVTLKYYVKGFDVKILNLTSDMYLEVSNSLGEKRTIYYSDTDNGTINLGAKEADQIITYSIKVVSINDECAGLDLRTIDLLIPKYNIYSESSYCNDNPDFQYCQKYFTSDTEIDFMKFDDEAKKYEENKNKTSKETIQKRQTAIEKIKYFFEKNKKTLVIIVICILIVGAIVTTIIVVKRRRRLI